MSDGARTRPNAPARGSRALKPKVVVKAPTDPVELLDQPVGLSGLAAASVLRRAGRRLGVERVRDLLFHLPRRYDDLRELRKLDDLHAAPDGVVVSARVRVTDIRVQQTYRRRVQVTTAFLADETGTAEATWFGRRFIERRLAPGRRAHCQRQAQAPRVRRSCSTTRSSRRPTRRTCSTSAGSCPSTG